MYQEAIDDGIRSERYNRNTTYFPLCCICGEEIMSISYIRNNQYTCKKCREANYFKDKQSRVDLGHEAKERKLTNAIKRIENLYFNASQYTEAIEKVHEKLHTDKWFQSTEEIMAALELLRRKIKTRHQVQFGKYTADFVLPEKKVVLEIDGVTYHTERTIDKEILRDELIVLSLGAEWEVIRITDVLINQNLQMLVKAITEVKKERQKLRAKNQGKLPEWYSNRERVKTLA